MRYRLFTQAVCLLLVVSVYPVEAGAQPAPGGPPAVGVVRVAKQQITQSNQFVGRIQSIGRVSLVARVSAFLEKREFVEGAEVKKGDLLYLLEQPPFQAQVDFNKANVAQLEAQHTFAHQQLARAEYLLKTPAGQQQNVDQTISNERSLAAQVASGTGAAGDGPDQSRLHRNPRPDRRQDQRHRGDRRQRRLADQRYARHPRQPGPDVCELSGRAAHRDRTARQVCAERRVSTRS